MFFSHFERFQYRRCNKYKLISYMISDAFRLKSFQIALLLLFYLLLSEASMDKNLDKTAPDSEENKFG